MGPVWRAGWLVSPHPQPDGAPWVWTRCVQTEEELSGVSAPQERGGDVDPRRGMAGGRRESFPSVGGGEREARARVPTSVHFVLEQVLRR